MAARDVPWVGRKVVRGVCQLMAGIVECLRKQPAKGVYHMAASWMHLRALRSEALDYEGLGREVVRSSALLGLGAFALILSLLPDGLVRGAGWVTGFEVDRAAGLEMLLTCQGEGGIYAPIAALGWLSFTIDTKAFLGEEQSADELEKCQALLQWARQGFPDSLFFGTLEADLHASRRKLPAALGVLDQAMGLPCLEELRALTAMLTYKKAVYHLAALEWLEAGRAFRRAQTIYKTAGRRSLGPSMAVYAAHCFCLDGGDGCAEAARDMLEEIAAYKALDKSNWTRPDRRAFSTHDDYENELHGDLDADWSLLHIATDMAITMRCTLWMDSDVANRFVALLDEACREDRPDAAALAAVCIAQTHAHQGSVEAGLACCAQALRDLSPVVGEASRKFGTLPALHYLEAHLHCAGGALLQTEASNRQSVEMTDNDMYLSHYLSFKTSQLGRIVKRRMEEVYVRLALPAGKMAVITIVVDPFNGDASSKSSANSECMDTTASTVGWDWKLEERDVDFHVCFLTDPEKGEEQEQVETEVVPMKRYSAAGGPVEGSFCLSSSARRGYLKLCFSNKHSYLRGKVVMYKLNLPHIATLPRCELI